MKQEQNEPSVTAMIMDGATIVHMLNPGTTKTFQQYADELFVPHITRWLRKVDRVDVVWDVYQKPSLKSSVREMRGVGCRRKVLASAPIPRKWAEFLQDEENKVELFSFLAQKLAQI